MKNYDHLKKESRIEFAAEKLEKYRAGGEVAPSTSAFAISERKDSIIQTSSTWLENILTIMASVTDDLNNVYNNFLICSICLFDRR